MGMNEKAQRFNAIKMIDGATGCSMSHLKVLQDALTNNMDHVLVMEDDITFIEPETLKTQFNKFILKHGENWDVILLGGNIRDYDEIDETCVKANKCGTTTGYIVNGHYIQILIDNIKKGINYLMRRPLYPNLYAIDVFWVGLQTKHNWYLIIPLTVVQMENYSDIEKRVTNYTKAMTKNIKPCDRNL
jgi:GR25 family glycosyltransferase involved in LPS biosynthesis